MIALDAVVKVEGGWGGLSAALREGERLALSEAERTAAKRRYGNLEKLIKAAGCETFADMVRQDTVICSIVRVPDYVLVTKVLPNTKLNTFEGSHQEQYPADTSIDELARIARRILEASESE
ncbi:hypothetical protein [Nitrosospira multiformis]|nr:hypothetical protein [Nitrosospira multiformis]